MHPTKRIKLDESTAKLARPFRSPLRSPSKADSRAVTNQETSVLTPEKQNLASSTGVQETSKLSSSLPTRESSKTPQRAVALSPIRPSGTLKQNNDGEYAALEKQYRALCLQLKQLQQGLDTAQQALKIETSGRDSELDVLISRWRAVAREAIEELFTVAKDRVNRMGGLGAWHKSTQRRSNEWTAEPEVNENDLTDEQRERLEVQKADYAAEAEKYGLGKTEQEPDIKDDDSFTIDMMLKQLNVDLDVVGYNKQQQRWQD